VVEELEEADELDMLQSLLDCELAQRLAVFPDCFVGNAQDV
jgi:hypothetical protein